MLAVSSALAVAACGVEFNGLFEGDPDAGPDSTTRVDAGTDSATRLDAGADSTTRLDATQDTSSTADRAPDVLTEATVDTSSPEGSIDGRDARGDVSSDGDAAIDASFDGNGGQDAEDEPPQDARAEDARADTRPDGPVDTGLDVVADGAADAPADTSPDGGDAAPPGTCSGVCNTFPDIGQTITRTVDQGSPPTMTGGNIVDGTYVATDVVQYNGDNTAYSISETSIIAGNMDAWVSSVNGQTPTRYTTTFTTSSNQMAFTFCCPSTGNVTITYTADNNSIRHIDPANPNRVITYTRQ